MKYMRPWMSNQGLDPDAQEDTSETNTPSSPSNPPSEEDADDNDTSKQ